MKDEEILLIAQKRIGYTFKNPRLLLTALTHSSFANEHQQCESNEKLEFLGDALLNFISAKRLFTHGENEGAMTVQRSRIVSRTPLEQAVKKIGLLELVRFGNGANGKDKNELSSKAVSDIFEAVLGAIYLDSNSIDICEKYIKNHLDGEIGEIDYKSTLQEIVQKNGKKVEYKTEDVGNVHQHFFRAVAFVDGKIVGQGEGRTKREAEKMAASKALESIKGRK